MIEPTRETAHRPWPLPAARWTWRQSWVDALFLHFPVSAAGLAGRVADGLHIEPFDGTAWVTLVAFRMQDVGRRFGRWCPAWWSFPELNARTYVVAGGRPGVWFFSLDADCLPVVLGGRFLYGLPYHRARMRLESGPGGWRMRSLRAGGAAAFDATWRATGPAVPATAGTFDHWATERYCLYASRRGALQRMEVHHGPWPLARCEVEIRADEVLAAAGIRPLRAEPVARCSPGVAVVSYTPAGVRGTGFAAVI